MSEPSVELETILVAGSGHIPALPFYNGLVLTYASHTKSIYVYFSPCAVGWLVRIFVTDLCFLNSRFLFCGGDEPVTLSYALSLNSLMFSPPSARWCHRWEDGQAAATWGVSSFNSHSAGHVLLHFCSSWRKPECVVVVKSHAPSLSIFSHEIWFEEWVGIQINNVKRRSRFILGYLGLPVKLNPYQK